MTDHFESTLRKTLKNVGVLKTSWCLRVETVGLYIEGKLLRGEKIKAEEHMASCLYCLSQLLELKELMYFQKQGAPLPSPLLEKIRDLYPKIEKPKKEFLKDTFSPLVRWATDLLVFPFRQWRYAAVSVIVALLAISITLSIRPAEKGLLIPPELNPNSFVQVRALSDDGKVLSESQGVIIDSQGLVATNLSPLIGASLTQITLKDGKTYQIKNLWKGEERNLALLKIETGALPALPIADLGQIHIGQRVLIVADPFNLKKGIESAIVSDFRSYPGRLAGGKIQYIQLASFAAQYTKGALIDQEGRLIGLLVTEEKNLSLASPLKEALTLIKEQRPIPVSELKDMTFNPEALNYYLKGILARDAQRNDEAMEYFKKTIALNPNLEGPHLELGYIYYRKRLYDLEIKAYQEVLRLNPKNTDALFCLAEAYETKGLYDLAIQEYEKIITLDPEDAEAYYNLGLAYLTQGQKEKAFRIYPKLKELDPGFGEKLKRLAR